VTVIAGARKYTKREWAAVRQYNSLDHGRPIRLLLLAWGVCYAGDLAAFTAASVYAYRAGGAGLVGVLGLARWVPAGVLVALVTNWSDRARSGRLLIVSVVTRALLLAAAAAAMTGGGLAVLVVLLVAFEGGLSSIFRHVQSALLPWLASTPDELTRANSAASALRAAAMVAGPALAAGLLAVGRPQYAVLAGCGLVAVGAVLLTGVRARSPHEPAPAAGRLKQLELDLAAGWQAGVWRARVRALFVPAAVQTFARGILTVLAVVIAIEVFSLGSAGVGWLAAALGAGGLLGGPLAARAIRGRKAARWFAAGVAGWGLPMILLAFAHARYWPYLMFGIIGLANVFDDAGVNSALQKVIPPGLTVRAQGTRRGALLIAMGLGSAVAPLLVHGLGVRDTLIATGLLLVVVAASYVPSLWVIDRRISAPSPDYALLRQVEFFSPMPSATLEHLASVLQPAIYEPGALIVREGEPGLYFYLIESGRARITKDGREVIEMGPGDSFGEIALLQRIPRTATVTAITRLHVRILVREEFLAAVTSNPESVHGADEVVSARMRTDALVAPAPSHTTKRRARAPSILQMEAVECGAVALAMVLAHYGRWVSLEELRAACGISRDGSRAGNLLRAARNYGLQAKGMRMDPTQLGSLPLPAIVFWEFNHFVVVDGTGPSGVHIEDPASGPRAVSWEDFDGSFTGVALSLRPGDGFERGGSPPSAWRGLLARLAGAWPAVTLCVLAGLGLLVPGLVVPAALRIFVDQYLVAGDSTWLSTLVIVMAVAAVAQIAFTWVQQMVLLRLSAKLSVTMSTRFFEHVLRLPITFFSQRYAGHIVNRIQFNDQIASLLSSQLASTALATLTALLYAVLMFIYDWQLSLVALGLASVNLFAIIGGRRMQTEANRRIVQEQGKVMASAVGGLFNIEAMKATSEDAAFFSRWAGQQAKLVTAQQDLAPTNALLASVPTFIGNLSTAAVIGIGAWQVLQGTLSLGTLTAFQVLVAGFNGPLGQLVRFAQTIQQAAASLAAIDDVLDHPLDPEFDAGPASNGHRPAFREARLSGAIELDHVTFGYSRLERPLIEDLCLRLEPGQRVALVGATGSGKSTVSRLAAGIAWPWSGRILLDGMDRREIPRPVLAATLALVDQDIRLFAGTVRDNLSLWDDTVTEEAMIAAAVDAAIHDDIVRRPGGYDRPILEGGADWSGGQRQRLEIARALAGEPSIIVLDEATSALDPLIELMIDQRLRARGCTCLIVAHRLSTIRDCDEIVVLDAGSVAERGRHDDLVALGGVYRSLVEA
jgi:NHLM bacteriocin system ABC transporter peptidase/ATP-binding protein